MGAQKTSGAPAGLEGSACLGRFLAVCNWRLGLQGLGNADPTMPTLQYLQSCTDVRVEP